MEIAGETDLAALTGTDGQRGTACVKKFQHIIVTVLAVHHVHGDDVGSFFGKLLVILADDAREIKSMTTAIGHIVGAPEEWQIGYQRVAGYLDGIF